MYKWVIKWSYAVDKRSPPTSDSDSIPVLIVSRGLSLLLVLPLLRFIVTREILWPFQTRADKSRNSLIFILITQINKGNWKDKKIIYCGAKVARSMYVMKTYTTKFSSGFPTQQSFPQVVETSVNVTNNNASRDYPHPDDQTTQTKFSLPGWIPELSTTWVTEDAAVLHFITVFLLETISHGTLPMLTTVEDVLSLNPRPVTVIMVPPNIDPCRG